MGKGLIRERSLLERGAFLERGFFGRGSFLGERLIGERASQVGSVYGTSSWYGVLQCTLTSRE